MNINSLFGRIQQRVIKQQPTPISQGVGVMNLRYSPQAASKPVEPSPKKLVNENAVKSANTMTWGKPTWYFLHTLAEKIKEEEFPQVRNELLDIIYSICVNLPCPECATHAKTYLDGIKFNSIQTKNDLKVVLLVFHNYVSMHKQYDTFSMEQLNELYSSAVTANVVNNFIGFYMKKHVAPKMIANEMFRRRIIMKIKDWLVENSGKFDP